MRALEAADVITLWERGAMRHALDRSALLVAAVRPELSPDDVVDLPLGTVSASLLRLLAANFGPRVAGHVDCAHCGERLELSLDVRTLLQPAPDDDPLALVAELGGLRVRTPSLRDLAAVADEPDVARAARRLLDRCTLSGPGAPVTDGQLREIEDALEALDPNADLMLTLRCEACGRESDTELDPGTLLWDAIEANARALLREVHLLATAYGWSEAEILALGAARRAAYLALVDA